MDFPESVYMIRLSSRLDSSPGSHLLQRMGDPGWSDKPGILMKSKTIRESIDNKATFTAMVAGLSGERLEALRATDNDKTLEKASFLHHG